MSTDIEPEEEEIEMELFDVEQVFDDQIFPLMKQVRDLCEQNGIPMIASFCFANESERGVGYCTMTTGGPPARFPETFDQILMILTKQVKMLTLQVDPSTFSKMAAGIANFLNHATFPFPSKKGKPPYMN